MSLAELQRVDVPDFGGEVTRLDPSNVPINQALLALNCEFNPAQVSTRYGFTDVDTDTVITDPVHSMTNWISNIGNFLIILRKNGKDSVATAQLGAMDLTTGGDLIGSGGMTPTAIGMSVAPGASYVYIATYTIDSTLIVQGDQGGLVGVPGTFLDPLFVGPSDITPTLGASGALHSVTPGVHRVGYLIQTNAGFSGRISPVDSSTDLFNTASVVTVAAGQQITFSVNFTWPAGSSLVYPVMTTVDNLARYFIVPGISPVSVVGGAASTVSFNIDISDADLVSTGTDITANQFLLTQNTAGDPPFLPFVILNFGSRVVYLTNIDDISQAYASEPNNGQQITADQHVLYLPGKRQMISAGALSRSLYILGPHWTYSFEDNGNVPVLWPEARLVDGTIGTLSPHGFTIDASTGLGWCADTTGLYAFAGGEYAALPVSYLNESDWKRINWTLGEYLESGVAPIHTASAEPVKVLDDKDKKRVYVTAPLISRTTVNVTGTAVDRVSGDDFPVGLPIDSTDTGACVVINGTVYSISAISSADSLTISTNGGVQTGTLAVITPIAPTDVLVFDYSAGIAYDKVKYSRWNIKDFSPGGACIVQDPITGEREFWLGRWDDTTQQASGPEIIRQMNAHDESPRQDYAQAIHWLWEGALLPGMDLEVGRVYYHYAQQIRATGIGTLSRTLYGLDRTTNVALTPVTLSTAPGAAITTRFPRLRSEGASYRFETNGVNEYCILAGLSHFFGLGPSYR